MTQPDLFTARPVVRSSPTLSAPERRRLSRQNAEILARLQRGTAARWELAEIAANVTARISDLRKAGYPVRLVEHNRVTGLTVYGLATEG